MTQRKERLTVTIDPGLLDAGNEAVASGKAESLSAWVNRALAERVDKERRLAALQDAVDRYEAQFGTITEGEIAAQLRADRQAAVVIRRSAAKPSRTRRSRGAA